MGTGEPTPLAIHCTRWWPQNSQKVGNGGPWEALSVPLCWGRSHFYNIPDSCSFVCRYTCIWNFPVIKTTPLSSLIYEEKKDWNVAALLWQVHGAWHNINQTHINQSIKTQQNPTHPDKPKKNCKLYLFPSFQPPFSFHLSVLVFQSHFQ